MSDAELIEQLGGPAKVCELLQLPKFPGVQRVSNWKKRGIPPAVKLQFPALFLPGMVAVEALDVGQRVEPHHAA